MPKVNVASSTSMNAQDSYNKVKSLLENDADLKKLDPAYSCQFNDSSLSGTASGNLFKAQLKVKDAAGGSEVSIEVDLPMKLALVKGMVQKTLQKKLDNTLG
ncbi:MAG: hypothetical protein CL675_13705 [Bdellovibrionaceae bacterium]|nr:hypothetical protein [Pseudobdellovibrionaceae bacterium]|tara:strand:- start:172 stop:477 length:306 start_codon:yes stop_codon:yes gene_type:complete